MFSTYRPEFESLERRELMAGDVSVSVSGNTVRITGDNYDNQIALESDSSGWVTVKGLDRERINRGSEYRFDSHGKDIKIELKNGHDSVTIDHLNYARGLDVNTGSGDDQAYVRDCYFSGDVVINMGDGYDYGRVYNTSVQKWQGRGGNLSIDMGRGDSNASVDNSHVGGDLTIKTAGSSYYDYLSVTGTDVGDDLELTAQGSETHTYLYDVDVYDDLKITTGRGRDYVDIFYTYADEIFVSLGDGTDDLELYEAHARKATLDGGQGYDYLTLNASHDIQELTVRNFERRY